MTAAAATQPGGGPWLQAINLAFAALFAVVGGLAAAWFFSGVREIGPGEQAVVFRFGAAVATHGPGLLITWPAPIGDVTLVPGPDQLLEVHLARFARPQPGTGEPVFDPRRNAAFVLTGDNGLVRLETTLFYTVTSAPAFLATRTQLEPALDRLTAAAIAAVAAGSDLDGVLVARPEAVSSTEAANRRERLRGAIVGDINRRLAALDDGDGGFGVRIARIDIAAALPEVLRPTYEGVLTALQKSEQTVAGARTVAASATQAAERVAITLRSQAQGAAARRVSDARTRTAELRALVDHADTLQRAPLLERLFRERIGRILEQAGSVTLVGPDAPIRLILPGAATP